MITSSASSFASLSNQNAPKHHHRARRFTQAKLLIGDEDASSLSDPSLPLEGEEEDVANAASNPTATLALSPSVMAPSFAPLSAYERVLMDAVRGNARDFNRIDMLDVIKGIMVGFSLVWNVNEW